MALGVGYIGEGPYNSKDDPIAYARWFAMLRRVYDRKTKHGRVYSYYDECSVDERWFNFQSFCIDLYKMKNWSGSDYHFDKDLRVLGNKKYGPKYCSLVPATVNSILHTRQRISKANLPTGVQLSGKKFTAKIGTLDGYKHLGTFNTPEEASLVYSKFKRSYIQEIALLYKSSLHPQVYKNLRNYPA